MSNDDLEREVRAALEPAFRCIDLNQQAFNKRIQDLLVPVVVRLIEAHRVPLIEALDAKFPGAPILSAEYMAMQERAEKAEAELVAYRVNHPALEAKLAERTERMARAEAAVVEARSDLAVNAARLLAGAAANGLALDRIVDLAYKAQRAEAAVVEARKAALLDAADAIGGGEVTSDGPVAKWLRARAEEQS